MNLKSIVFFSGFTIWALLGANAEEGEMFDWPALNARAAKESLAPIRPGEPTQTPFWNAHAKRFIYAPAFDFKPLKGVNRYRFLAISEKAVTRSFFITEKPWTPLTEIWKNLPVGDVSLTVDGVGDNNVLSRGIVGQREFYRAAVFNGPYNEPALDYKDCVFQALKALFKKPYVQQWRETGSPDPAYGYYSYPSKMTSAVIEGMLLFAGLTDDPAEKQQAIEIAKGAADFIIKIRQPKGAYFEFWPPTYLGQEFSAENNKGQIVLIYPANVGKALTLLYNETKETKYLDAAVKILNTYQKRRLDSGTWILKARMEDGTPVTKNVCIPVNIIDFLDLVTRYENSKEYQQLLDDAVQWMFDNPIKTFNWEAQFEDVPPTEPYENLNVIYPGLFVGYLTSHSEKNPEYAAAARDITRFCEDQFAVWEQPRLKHVTPCALEQYFWYKAIDAATSRMAYAFLSMYKITEDDLYLAKAITLANSITIAQQTTEDGLIPTYLDDPENKDFWINCLVIDAYVLLELDRILSESKS